MSHLVSSCSNSRWLCVFNILFCVLGTFHLINLNASDTRSMWCRYLCLSTLYRILISCSTILSSRHLSHVSCNSCGGSSLFLVPSCVFLSSQVVCQTLFGLLCRACKICPLMHISWDVMHLFAIQSHGMLSRWYLGGLEAFVIGVNLVIKFKWLFANIILNRIGCVITLRVNCVGSFPYTFILFSMCD
jgi:hypothetical protein